MEATLIYAIIVGGCLAAFGLRQCFLWFSRTHGPSLTTFLFKHFVYPYLLPRIRLFGLVFIGPMSWMQVLLQTAYWVGTAICNVLGVKNLNEAGLRAGRMAIINLVPLSLGDRVSFMTSLLGIPPRVGFRVHSTLGWMATIQALVHVLLSVKQHPLDLKDIKLRFALVAAICMLALFLFSLPLMRQLSYELFLKSHYTFGILVLLGLWRHLEPQLSPGRALLLACMALLTLTKAARWLSILYRNILAGKPWPKGKFFPTGRTDGVELRVRVGRHWTPRNNQHIYVCVPGVSPSSFMQSHPYCVAWWEYDKNGRLDTVSLLIKPYQGFSSYAQRMPKNAEWKSVAIDGPYGSPVDIAPFGTLVVFATGIGIAAQLPLLKQALEQRASDLTPLRRILLVWLTEESSEMDWVQPWMQRILDMDLQFTRERYGYSSMGFPEAQADTPPNGKDGDLKEGDDDERENKGKGEKKKGGDAKEKIGFIHNKTELENWEEDKLIFRSEIYAVHSQGANATIGRRTNLFKGKLPDVRAIIMREYADRFGKMLVTVCAEPETRDRVRRAACAFIGSDMKYQEMGFQPVRERDLWTLKLTNGETCSRDTYMA